METCFNYTGETAFFSSDERKWINKIRKLKEQRPDEVTILAEPETNDGCIYAKVPAHYLKLQPKMIISDERKEELAERIKKARTDKQDLSRTPKIFGEF